MKTSRVSPAALRLTETLTEEVRHLDEKSAAVAAKAGLDLAGERIKAVTIQVVVVTQIKSGPGIRRPTKKKLALDVCGDRVKVDPSAGKYETTKLIRRPQRKNVLVKRHAPGVIADESFFGDA